jgi:hypothetical protein
MNMNRIGKFEARKIVGEFDDALIEIFGRNMSDARITRFEALSAFEETQDVRKAAELAGTRKGLVPLVR